MGYLGKILEFSLTMLRKLSAPAEVDELKATHQKFLEDLSDICRVTDASRKSHIIALVRGLQFVLEQIQVRFL